LFPELGSMVQCYRQNYEDSGLIIAPFASFFLEEIAWQG